MLSHYSVRDNSVAKLAVVSLHEFIGEFIFMVVVNKISKKFVKKIDFAIT
ncbi:MAG: hypothetical protein RL173_3009 [Fibrobacterota bacterium]|jgi:hypothetical protein